MNVYFREEIIGSTTKTGQYISTKEEVHDYIRVRNDIYILTASQIQLVCSLILANANNLGPSSDAISLFDNDSLFS